MEFYEPAVKPREKRSQFQQTAQETPKALQHPSDYLVV
jgi:hypothetical protein